MPQWRLLNQGGNDDNEDDPGRRSSHAMAGVSSEVQRLSAHLFLFGGERTPRVPLPAALFACDATGGDGGSKWRCVAVKGQGPGARIAPSLCAARDGRLVLFGGRAGMEMGEGALDDAWVIDVTQPEPLRWQRLDFGASDERPPARSFHAAAADAANGLLFVFGGCGAGGRLRDLWQLDVALRRWELLSDGANSGVTPRGGAALVFDGSAGCLRLIGGFDGGERRDVHTFDVRARRWACSAAGGDGGVGDKAQEAACGSCCSNLAQPFGRSVFGAVVHRCDEPGCAHTGHVVTHGGEVEPSDRGHSGAGAFVGATLCMSTDGGGDAWHELAASEGSGGSGGGGGGGPGPRGWFAAASTPQGDLLVHGGLGGDNERLGDLWVLRMHE